MCVRNRLDMDRNRNIEMKRVIIDKPIKMELSRKTEKRYRNIIQEFKIKSYKIIKKNK